MLSAMIDVQSCDKLQLHLTTTFYNTKLIKKKPASFDAGCYYKKNTSRYICKTFSYLA